MNLEYLLILLIPAMSWLDRQRGTPKEIEVIPKLPALLLMGYAVAVLTGHWNDWQAAAITGAFAVLHNFGYGQPLGEALTGRVERASDGSLYEFWQVGPLKNCWLALAFRGGVLGLAGVAALDFVAAVQIMLAWLIAFPLAPAFVRYVIRDRRKAWERNEYLRGAFAGLFMFALVITPVSAQPICASSDDCPAISTQSTSSTGSKDSNQWVVPVVVIVAAVGIVWYWMTGQREEEKPQAKADPEPLSVAPTPKQPDQFIIIEGR